MAKRQLYSIGYATKPIAVFLAQLQQYGISAVADVRSVPYSKAFHDYHQEAFAATLKSNGIHYVYLGAELGPRSRDDHHYDACGQVQFDRLAQSPLYLQGVERLQNGLDKGLNIALMCAEKDPADCHRSLLIGFDLKRRLGLELAHITHDGGIETQPQLEQRMAETHGAAQDLFASPEQLVELGCRAQSKLKAYRRPE
ncbi:DUF488 family protein [Ketobacter sp.]|uniref:DUF488 domain-containing protein n=1 Tax=Ketobacter sp. TaxID=2083498 RepID=UPI000F26D5A8|nr:DUF488 domain-containing protein [Ketobacter sp.]RLT94526.1 MAG: DUF488 domain-containing protein [Ketobacter sp.]